MNYTHRLGLSPVNSLIQTMCMMNSISCIVYVIWENHIYQPWCSSGLGRLTWFFLISRANEEELIKVLEILSEIGCHAPLLYDCKDGKQNSILHIAVYRQFYKLLQYILRKSSICLVCYVNNKSSPSPFGYSHKQVAALTIRKLHRIAEWLIRSLFYNFFQK